MTNSHPKIGLIGVGKWGRILAEKLITAGAEIAAHDRRTDVPMPDRFGVRMPWREILNEKKVDAIVAATPPDVTAEIYTVCQDERIPCLLTKPLIEVDWNIARTTTYVDLVHLHSPLWLATKRLIGSRNIRKVTAVSSGMGPDRGFPGSIDYGPHAVSLILDALNITPSGIEQEKSILSLHPRGGETLWASMNVFGTEASFTASSCGARLTVFSAFLTSGHEISYMEQDRRAYVLIDGTVVVSDLHHDPLARCVENFLCDAVAERRFALPNLHYLKMSCHASQILVRARDQALRTGETSPSAAHETAAAVSGSDLPLGQERLPP